ncbi:MAG: hypothetical protein SFY32_07235 [Bacteroidota bacterium]|nr:hypothetical protein [Bacteroidota bacterium]
MKKVLIALSLVSFLGTTALIAGNDKEKKACSTSDKKSCCHKKKDASCGDKKTDEKKTEEKPQ